MRRNRAVLWGVSLLVSMFLLVSCKVSDEYQGDWFARDIYNNEVMISINNKYLIYDNDEHPLKQVGEGTENGVKYFKIELDGADFTLVYPEKDNKDEANIIAPDDENEPTKGKATFRMNRKEYPGSNFNQ